MNVDIYMPRLDVPFKKSNVPKERSPISDLRQHWKEFVNKLATFHLNNGDNTRILELPLWQITEELVSKESLHAHRIYIPHKMKANWYLDERVQFYMQMVIPNIFSIDSLGWCASASNWPISIRENSHTSIFDVLAARASHNISKFKQPNIKSIDLPERFILFPCQLPHDETIRFHSDVSVEQALSAVIEGIQQFQSCSLIIKGHPANPIAMKSLYNIYLKYKQNWPSGINSQLLWIDNVSIHSLIKKSQAVFTVNSGVGLESILHFKKVYTFGFADYSSISTKIIYGGNLENAKKAVQAELKLLFENNTDYSLLLDYKQSCKYFISNWYDANYDCFNLQTFNKLAL